MIIILCLSLLVTGFLLWKNYRLSLQCALAEQKLQTQEERKSQFEEVASQALHQTGHVVGEAIEKLRTKITEIENERKFDHGMIRQQMTMMLETEGKLKTETANLVKALRAPLSRGQWGEMQLKRVVELAGMLEYCDFVQQTTGGDSRLRPDLIVRLAGGRQVVIDAKVPLEAYLEAIEKENELERVSSLKSHARQVRAHIQSLGKKAYWDSFQPTPEFVILFLPSETIYGMALEQDPSLIEVGVSQNVMIATPTTLIALLRAIAYGWKQENLSAHAEKIQQLGAELYKRIGDMTDHFGRLGRALNSAVEAFNKTTGSLETRVLVTARKFQEMGAASSTLEISPLETIDRQPKDASTV